MRGVRDALDLVKGVLNCNMRQAIEWSKKWLVRDGGQLRPLEAKGDDNHDEAHRIARALAIWDEAINPRGTLVDTYLSRRALELTNALADDVIRYHRGMSMARERQDDTRAGDDRGDAVYRDG